MILKYGRTSLLPYFFISFTALTVIAIGKVALVGLSYTKLLKEAAPDKFMLTAVCANGYEGYFPTAEAFAQGGYEAISSLYTSELEKQILTASKEMLNKF